MRRLAVLALLLGSASPVLAAADNLPPEPAVVAVLDNYPGVTAAGARVDAARAGATMLRKGTHEVLLSGSYIVRDVTNERRYSEFDGTVSRAFRLPGKAALDRKAGALGVEVAQNRMEDARHQAALLLSQLWFDWLSAGELRRTDLANVALLEQALHAVERRAQLRDAALLDVDQARAALDQARGLAAGTLADREQAHAVLSATFPDLPLPPEPPALGTPQLPAQDLGALRDLVIARSHEIRAADRDAARLGTLAERARRDRMADPTIGLRAFSERSGMERGGGLVLSIPLGGGYRKAVAEQAGAEASAGLLDLAQVRRAVEATADADRSAARDRTAAWERLAASAQSAEAAAIRTARGHELGAVDLSDALLARRLAGDARRMEIAARTDAIRALMKLQIDAHVIWMSADDAE
ncbi:TolC family protein [Novosphingobium sp. KCTC 2891]|uniref:TolC family protein n=1 Tax=Novosphingobium sp. KCTC 2891 TaxID=2989730 RepID=UPI002222C994|nr:TolC family protein [Novosphingobium sp. KCTC 2891]MCW1382537.1 TolC family protein [Novosphingobium sp. KCTC 2891]